MSHIIIERFEFTDESTIGQMFIDGEPFCHTLEDVDRHIEGDISKKVYGKTAIPCGHYELRITRSRRFGRDMPEIFGVEGFTGVRIHRGNDADDTEGCPIVGEYTEGVPDFVGNSRATEARMMNRLSNIETHTLEVRRCE